MPNVGRPSLACQTCKTRRVKCDFTKPYCLRCKKAGRSCPGVPEMLDAVMRDQRLVIVAKSKAHGSPTPIDTPSDSSESDVEEVLREGPLGFKMSDFKMSITKEPYIPIVNQAVAFFFRHYVVYPKTPEQPVAVAQDWTSNMYSKARPSSPLELTTSALAMTILSKFPDRHSLAPQAQDLYSQALRRVGTALTDQDESLSDETLLSIMLLNVYEALALSEWAVPNFQRHLDGAVALLKYRGRRRINGEKSLRLFRAVRTYMVMNHIVSSEPLEPFSDEDDWTWESDLNPQPVDQLSCISTRVPGLRSRIMRLENSEPTTENIEEAMALLLDAAEVDNMLKDWYASIPGYMKYTTVSARQGNAPEGLNLWPGVAHIFETVWIGGFTNNYRTQRIYIHGVIVRTRQWLFPTMPDVEPTSSQQVSLRVIQQLVDEICASVPYMMGIRLDKTHLVAASGKDKVASGASGGWFLLWTLWSACEVETISTEQREWMRCKLEFIKHFYGFVQPKIWSMTAQTGITQA